MTADEWVIPVRVTPKSAKDYVGPVHPDHDAIPVKVTAAPDKGQANQAVIALLADTFKLPKSRFRLHKGQTGRDKQIAVEVNWDAEDWAAQLSSIFRTSPACWVIHSL